jgi:hypothetical protein
MLEVESEIEPKIDNARIKELIEQSKQAFPGADEYLLWLSVVDYQVRDELKIIVPENSDLIDLFKKELNILEY